MATLVRNPQDALIDPRMRGSAFDAMRFAPATRERAERQIPMAGNKWIDDYRANDTTYETRRVLDQISEDAYKASLNGMQPEQIASIRSALEQRARMGELVGQYGEGVAPRKRQSMFADVAERAASHPFGADKVDESSATVMRSALSGVTSAAGLKEFQETPEGMRMFGISDPRALASATLKQIRPDLFDQVKSITEQERESEGRMAAFYKSVVDPDSTLNAADMAARVRERPELKARYNEMYDKARETDNRREQLINDYEMFSRTYRPEAARLVSAADAESFVERAASSGMFGDAETARKVAKKMLESSNPKVYRAMVDADLAKFDEPVSRLTKAQQGMTIRTPLDNGGYTEVVVGDRERELLMVLQAAQKRTDEDRGGAILNAEKDLRDLYEGVERRANQQAEVIRWGSMAEVVATGEKGDTPGVRAVAKKQVLAALGGRRAVYALNNSIQNGKINFDEIIEGSGIVREKWGEGLGTQGPSDDAMAQSIVAGMIGLLAPKYGAATQEQVDAALQKSMIDAMKKGEVSIFGKDSARAFVERIDTRVREMFDERTKSVFTEVDKERQASLASTVDKVMRDSAVVTTWGIEQAAGAYSSVAQRLGEPGFRAKYDFDNSGEIDKPDELAAAYLAGKHGDDGRQVARIATAQGFVDSGGIDAARVANVVNGIGETLMRGREAYLVKESVEVQKIVESDARLGSLVALVRGLRLDSIDSDTLSFNPRRPMDNVVVSSSNKMYIVAHPAFKRDMEALSDKQLELLTLDSQEGIIGLGENRDDTFERIRLARGETNMAYGKTETARGFRQRLGEAINRGVDVVVGGMGSGSFSRNANQIALKDSDLPEDLLPVLKAEGGDEYLRARWKAGINAIAENKGPLQIRDAMADLHLVAHRARLMMQVKAENDTDNALGRLNDLAKDSDKFGGVFRMLRKSGEPSLTNAWERALGGIKRGDQSETKLAVAYVRSAIRRGGGLDREQMRNLRTELIWLREQAETAKTSLGEATHVARNVDKREAEAKALLSFVNEVLGDMSAYEEEVWGWANRRAYDSEARAAMNAWGSNSPLGGKRNGGAARAQEGADEARFQQWYQERARKAGININPDDPLHRYDYRAAYRAGVEPKIDPSDGKYHWDSRFKKDDHPNRYVDGVDTKTGLPVGAVR